MQTKVSTPRSADGGVGGGKGSGFGVQGRHRRGGKGAKRSAGGGQRGRGWCREQPHGRTRTDTDRHGPRGGGEGLFFGAVGDAVWGEAQP